MKKDTFSVLLVMLLFMSVGFFIAKSIYTPEIPLSTIAVPKLSKGKVFRDFIYSSDSTYRVVVFVDSVMERSYESH